MSWKPTLEYLAGLIDGEGHIGCQVYGGAKRPCIQINMTCPLAVGAFAAHFELPMRPVNSPSHLAGYAKGYKQIYQARAECHRAYWIIKALRPYLLTKAAAADEALAYYENRSCIVCTNPIPVELAKSARYCSSSCRIKAWKTGKARKDWNKPHQ